MLTLSVLLTGCLQLPESGPVVNSGDQAVGRGQSGPFIEPAPPAPGESPAEIVRHFLDAMTATSLQTNVAREYLSQSARAGWNPKARTITYASATAPQGTNLVTFELEGANGLDGRGAWQGPLADQSFTFPMVIEDGEYRIADAPDALIVPERWFDLRFRPVSLYFFDPAGDTLVPEPVYVPLGEQLASSAVSGLLAGPIARRGTGDRLVTRTFAPPGLEVALSVVVDEDRVAHVDLQGDRSAPDPEATRLFLGQLAWTLRQDPRVRSFQVNLNGQPVSLPEGGTELGVDYGGAWDPAGAGSSSLLFGLRDGLLVRASPGSDESLDGPFGRTAFGLREVSLDLDAKRVAAVTTDGARLLLAEADNAESGAEEVISGGIDLAKPSWDAAGRLWVLDRRPEGARLSVVLGEQQIPVRLAGVSGERVQAMIISRDGTRYAAIVRPKRANGAPSSRAAGPEGDRVIVGRIRQDGSGGAPAGVDALVVTPRNAEAPLRITALAWVS
ncbi:MAG: LpqB family beta-propeller domain-containing protein, partial [Nocardioides sp.]